MSEEPEGLGREVAELAAHTHAALAELAQLVARFEEAAAWSEAGIRSCAHWLSVNAGFDLGFGGELVRVGRALGTLPAIVAGFRSGELSFDKVRALTRVAIPADDEMWAELGRQATASQLVTICRDFRRALEAEAPEAHLSRRGLWTHWRDDGMLRLLATLPPEDGAAVLAAIESAAPSRPPDDDPADDPWAARAADALAAVCRGGSGAAPAQQVVVHVDLDVLTGESEAGSCRLAAGPPLAVSAALRLGCDATIVAVTELEGIPIDVGRARQFVSAPLRRALQARDRGCRFPGCGVPAGRSEAHHVEHWVRGGRTDLANLVSLCGFHHHRLHEGAFEIRSGHFVRPDGRRLGSEVHRVAEGSGHIRERARRAGHRIEATTPAARDGNPFDRGYVAEVLSATRARPAGP